MSAETVPGDSPAAYLFPPSSESPTTNSSEEAILPEISFEMFSKVLNSLPVLSHFTSCLDDSGIGWECLRLRLVTLPNLRFLKLAGFPEREGVKKFLSRSACAIDHLVISFAGYEVDVEEDANTIFEWLLEFPTVSVF
ncbi:hypothetical protein B0H14DRAFT_3430378 [Mycena olivaceomarginata]|nr:hypothetical protein B0H14DRAFT_3430378 [Mycena olivaceomarginata]